MIGPEALALIGTVGPATVTAVGATVGVWLGRKNGEKQGKENAKVSAREAADEARRAVTADWESYTKLLMLRLEAVEDRAGTAEKRLDSAETRAVIAEERAARWESLYRIAVQHMRKLIAWASDVSHMSDMPEAPAELLAELPERGKHQL